MPVGGRSIQYSVCEYEPQCMYYVCELAGKRLESSLQPPLMLSLEIPSIIMQYITTTALPSSYYDWVRTANNSSNLCSSSFCPSMLFAYHYHRPHCSLRSLDKAFATASLTSNDTVALSIVCAEPGHHLVFRRPSGRTTMYSLACKTLGFLPQRVTIMQVQRICVLCFVGATYVSSINHFTTGGDPNIFSSRQCISTIVW